MSISRPQMSAGVILSTRGGAICRSDALAGARSRPLYAGSPPWQGIIYFRLKKEQKAPANGPIMKTSIHCFGGNSRDIIGLQALRRGRSQSPDVDREIRTLWRALAGVGIGPSRAARGCIRNTGRRRSVRFLAAGHRDRLRQDRVFLAGSVVFQLRRIGLDAQRAAIGAGSALPSPNLTRPASTLDRIPAGMRR